LRLVNWLLLQQKNVANYRLSQKNHLLSETTSKHMSDVIDLFEFFNAHDKVVININVANYGDYEWQTQI
jgi:hypothetical protein